MRKALTGLLLATAWAPISLAAHSPVRGDMETIRALAHRVESSARKLHRSAERDRHHLDWREEMAFRRLHDLERSAALFHRTVEGRACSLASSERDFRRLVVAYRRAASSLDDLHPDRQVWRDWGRLELDMERLMDVYGGMWRRDERDRRYEDDHQGAFHGRYRTRGGGTVGIDVRW